MAGYQFGFDFSSEADVVNLFTTVVSRLKEYIDLCKLTPEAIVYVQINFRKKDKKLLSEFSLDKPSHISKQENIITESMLTIPVSINKDSIGDPLTVSISNGIITNINLIINSKQLNLLDIIKNKAKLLRANHKDNITSFYENLKFYLLKDKYDYVLAVKLVDNHSIEKIRYSIDGVIINHVTDVVVDNSVIRSSGERQVVIKGDKIAFIKQNIKIKPIDKPSIKPLFVENNNIGVIVIETYRANDNTFKVYALGFKTILAEKPVIYYIDKDNLDYRKIILSLVNELLRPKYSNIIFYCHNLGGFDIVYTLKALYIYNDDNPNDKYEISPLLRDEKIIKVKISKNKNTFTILDSYAMLADKLSRLGKNFDVATIKSNFPYKFAVQDHLFYEGVIPSIDCYEDITEQEYKDMFIGY